MSGNVPPPRERCSPAPALPTADALVAILAASLQPQPIDVLKRRRGMRGCPRASHAAQRVEDTRAFQKPGEVVIIGKRRSFLVTVSSLST